MRCGSPASRACGSLDESIHRVPCFSRMESVEVEGPLDGQGVRFLIVSGHADEHSKQMASTPSGKDGTAVYATRSTTSTGGVGRLGAKR